MVGWRPRWSGFHLPSHMSLQLFGQVIPRDKIKTLYLHFHITCKHRTWHIGDVGWRTPSYWATCLFDHVIRWCRVISTSRRSKSSNSGKWWLRLRGSNLPDHMSLLSFGHVRSRVKIKTLYIELDTVVT